MSKYSLAVVSSRADLRSASSDANSKTPNLPFAVMTSSGEQGTAGESGATNLGPRSQELLDYTKTLIAYWHRRGVNPTSDLVTTSGSGIDPDITPQDAQAEIPMVSRATGVSAATLQRLISQQTNSMQLGFLGSPYVNVLQLNEALAKLKS